MDRFESSGEATRARMQVVPEDELWLHLSRAQFFASISNGTNRQFLVGNAPCLSVILVKMCPSRVKSFGCSGIVILGLTHLYKANLMLFQLLKKVQLPRQLPSVYSQNAKTKSIALSFSDMVGAVLSSWSLLVMIASLSSGSSDLSGQTSRRHRFLNPINVVGNFALGKSPNIKYGFLLIIRQFKTPVLSLLIYS